MKVRTHFFSAALGLCLGASLTQGEEPRRLRLDVSENQRIASTIATTLNESHALRGFKVGISYQAGVAHLTGTVHDQAQREEVVRLAQSVAGVEQVRDQLQLTQGGEVVQAQAPPVPAKPIPAPPPVPTMPPPGFGPVPAPPGFGGPLPNVGGIQEPLPLSQIPPGFPSAHQPPPMPPYAWPTVAPYNNYSRVAYPTQYPYETWPFIGPMYPFPRVPLGWRSVQLTWEDGHWWYGQRATGHDWWRIRYH